MLEILKCGQCGGELDEVSSGVYRCACCGNLYTKKEQDVEAAFRASLGDERYARLSAARQNLWTAMHAEFINSAACLNYARELKSYAPSDYYANFAEVANAGDDKNVIDFLNKSGDEDTDKYADAVLDFMLRSLTRKMLSAVSFYIDRSFEKDTKEYVYYRDIYERESEKVEKGMYEPGLPRDVFLAYSSADIMYVNDLCAHLEEQNMTCFVSSKNLRHGRGAAENYDEALKTAMDNCSVFVFISSKNSRDLSCDAFKKEIPYIMDRDRKNAPPEYRTLSYDKLPEKYKTKRVEYLVDGYGKGSSSAEKTVKMFFSGLEWRQTRDEVSDTITKYMTEMPDGERRGRLSDEDVRKVADAVNEGKGPAVSLEEKESRVIKSVKTLLSVGDFATAKRRLDAISDEEFESWGTCSAAVYLCDLMTECEVPTYSELVEKLAREGRDVTRDKFYLLALESDDSPEKDVIAKIPELVAAKRTETGKSEHAESRAEKDPAATVAETIAEPVKTREAPGSEPVYAGFVRSEATETVKAENFDFAGANAAQRKAITVTEGPVLITAGPGTGKTFTLVQRAIYLMQVKDIKAEEIFIATYTNKAANEITTRITNEMAHRKIPASISDMYIGTFHSLCHRIIKDHIELTRLPRNFDFLDEFDQQYLVYQNLRKFRDIAGYFRTITTKKYNDDVGWWDQAGEVCRIINALSEEEVDAESMRSDEDAGLRFAGEALILYKSLLEERNAIDFSGLQTECYTLLVGNPDILEKLQKTLKYFMIDEYQDSNNIQEKLIFLLGGKSNNICVVGDDDQSLYRFRGATIRNILQFEGNFKNGECTVVKLETNYRSDPDIVKFYNGWMSKPSWTDENGERAGFSWAGCRLDKTIVAAKEKKTKSSAVVKIVSDDSMTEWHEKVYRFVKSLMDTGKITDYNQVAFLFRSVKKNAKGKGDAYDMARYLEERGIKVYTPRSQMFFQRDEIKLAVGCLLRMFQGYSSYGGYYSECLSFLNDYITKSGNRELSDFLLSAERHHAALSGKTGYGFSGLLYRLFMYRPFCDILDAVPDGNAHGERAVRNLAILTQRVKKFERLYNVDTLDSTYLAGDMKRLFGDYLRVLIDNGVTEYEDEADYAPSGCVSFMTFHQSKGMEFPVVIVGSLDLTVWENRDKVVKATQDGGYFKKPSFEPYDSVLYFDFWRTYYVAFSRAQSLLVLTCDNHVISHYYYNEYSPSEYFKEILKGVVSVDDEAFDIDEFSFDGVKKSDIKEKFSFTSDIAVYEGCPRQYKFYRTLGFEADKREVQIYGTLIHQTLQDIHIAAKNGRAHDITEGNIRKWFERNYETLSATTHSRMKKEQRETAFRQVLRYAKSQSGQWDRVIGTETDVSYPHERFIIGGRIDLVKKCDDGTAELVDFKSESKPDPAHATGRLRDYYRQLELYAYLYEKQTGTKVSRLSLYFTADESGSPMLSVPYTQGDVMGNVEAFEGTVKKILDKDFSGTSHDFRACEKCDFKYYCRERKG